MFIVKMQQGIFNGLRYAGVLQKAVTHPAIQIFLQLAARRSRISSIFSIMFNHSPRRKAGMESAKRNVMNWTEVRKIAMWQITTFMPAKKTKRLFIVC